MRRFRDRQKGFTLIELLIVVAIIGIIAAILIPNLLDALQKAKQKRTVADERSVGTATMSYIIDEVGAASAGQSKIYRGSGLNDLTYEALFARLHPTDTFYYMQEVPEIDGWQYDFEYGLNPRLTDTAVFMVCSGGRNGEYEATVASGCTEDWPVGPFISTDYDQDIVWADGYFVRYPDKVKPKEN